MVDVNQEHPDRNAEPPATVFGHQDWIMVFVVVGSANVVYFAIIVVKIVTVLQDYIVMVCVSLISKMWAIRY